MNRIAVLAVSVLLLAAPAWAVGTLQYFDSLGGQGVTALYAPANGLVSDIDYNAGSAEGGSCCSARARSQSSRKATRC